MSARGGVTFCGHSPNRRLASAEHLEPGELVLDVRVTGHNSKTDISAIILQHSNQVRIGGQ